MNGADDYVGPYVKDATPEEAMGFKVWDGKYEKFVVYEVLTRDLKIIATLGNAGVLHKYIRRERDDVRTGR